MRCRRCTSRIIGRHFDGCCWLCSAAHRTGKAVAEALEKQYKALADARRTYGNQEKQ